MANNNIPEISSEKFRFVNTGERLTDKKFNDKPIGYFKDAWIRFRKNKASIVSAIIIALIVVYAIVTPLFVPHSETFLDTRYQKLPPRIAAIRNTIGLMNGGKDSVNNVRGYINLLSLGVAAEDIEGGKIVSLGEGKNSDYSAIISSNGMTADERYKYVQDAYLAVGFIYRQVDQAEYDKIVAWEQETGLKVLYPLVASNEYSFDTANANWWYKSDSKGNPVKVTVDANGNATVKKISTKGNIEEIVLEDNYRRDENGNVMFSRPYGGGSNGTHELEIRVLYYNYFQYVNGFTPDYLLGTDSQGYDLALRLAGGIRLSLIVAISVSVINFILGAAYGAIEGYYGGAVDMTLERISDILSGVPFIVVATLFQMYLAKDVGPVGSLLFAFVLTGWIGTASRVRTQFYRFKNSEYVMAARTLGASDARIIWKHIFPNSLGTIITSSALVIPSVIFSESMLSFLGIINLGAKDGTSLGQLLSDASSQWTNYPHLLFYPAIVISLLMICFNLFGNGLRDAFNPSLRGVED